jgi:predicted metalloprotease
MPTSILIISITALLAPVARGAEITEADVRRVQARLAIAQRYLEVTWKSLLPKEGTPTRMKWGSGLPAPLLRPMNPEMPMPRIVAYRNSINSQCGILGSQNAHFCPVDRTIYYDEVFLTQLAKSAGAALGSQGDYAAVVALAHEFGHAVAFSQDSESCNQQKRNGGSCYHNPFDFLYFQEATADCYAGSVTGLFRSAQLLNHADIEEAQFAMDHLGDAPKSMPNLPDVIAYSHGTGTARRKHFDFGYWNGALACGQVIENDNLPARRANEPLGRRPVPATK